MVEFHLIRHAKTSWNLEKKIQGSTDVPLCAEGELQAGAWAEKLCPEGYDMILTSPMVRAKQTAQIIAEKTSAEVIPDSDLREQDFGRWEGEKIEALRQKFPGQVELQEKRGWSFCPPGGEARSDVLNRSLSSIKKISETYGKRKILLVSHSSVMKCLIYKLLGRAFVPGEPAVIKNYHLHELVWDKRLEISRLNRMELP